MKSKNVGIVTWYKSENYGTNLQAYALYKYISDLGYNCCLVNEFSIARIGIKYKVLNILNILGILSFIKKYFSKSRNRKRFIAAINFFDHNTLIRYVYTNVSYIRLLNEIDTFISGSDQIWNPNFLNTFYLLDFAKNKKRIAYSSSFGVSNISENDKEIMRPLLKKFNALGIREQTGVAMVNMLIAENRAIQVVDPTLLLLKETWDSVAKLSKLEIEDEYVFCYLIGNKAEYSVEVADVIIKSGLKKVCIVHSIENPSFKLSMDNIQVEYVSADGIEDFLYLLSHSSFVCTDSFHATAICLKYQKQFVEFLRFDSNDFKSQNSRIMDILSAYDIQSQMYNKKWEKLPKINYDDVTKKLERDIFNSKFFLINALKN